MRAVDSMSECQLLTSDTLACALVQFACDSQQVVYSRVICLVVARAQTGVDDLRNFVQQTGCAVTNCK